MITETGYCFSLKEVTDGHSNRLVMVIETGYDGHRNRLLMVIETDYCFSLKQFTHFPFKQDNDFSGKRLMLLIETG